MKRLLSTIGQARQSVACLDPRDATASLGKFKPAWAFRLYRLTLYIA